MTQAEMNLELARAHLARWAAEAKYVQLAYNLAASELAKAEAAVQEENNDVGRDDG